MDDEEDEEELSRSSLHYSSGSELESPIEISSSMSNSDQSSLDITPRISGRNQSSRLRRTLPASGQGGASSYITDLPVPASQNVSAASARSEVFDCGLLPAVPPQFGTMATTITLQRSSTTSEVVPHSATCSTSLKATSCSCKSKDRIRHSDLKWSSLPATGTGTTGRGAPKARRSSQKRSKSNSKGV